MLETVLRSALAAAVIGGLLAPVAWADEAALAEAGKRQWIRCSGCHALSAEAPPMFGPHLEGIVGRRGGTVEGFEYTDPILREQGVVWDEAYLDEWLADPRAKYPEMCLAFHGVANPEIRKALVAFLKNPTS